MDGVESATTTTTIEADNNAEVVSARRMDWVDPTPTTTTSEADYNSVSVDGIESAATGTTLEADNNAEVLSGSEHAINITTTEDLSATRSPSDVTINDTSREVTP